MSPLVLMRCELLQCWIRILCLITVLFLMIVVVNPVSGRAFMLNFALPASSHNSTLGVGLQLYLSATLVLFCTVPFLSGLLV